MKVYSQIISVQQKHLDELNHVNNVTYVQWIQDIAKAHWLAATNKTLQENYKWVVRKHEITYHQQAFLNDEILIETYIEKNKGALFLSER